MLELSKSNDKKIREYWSHNHYNNERYHKLKDDSGKQQRRGKHENYDECKSRAH